MRDLLVVVKDFEFNGRNYKVGDRFKIIGEDSMRGLDIEDMYGNKIYETRMISDHFKYSSLQDERDKKLRDIGI